ncbi:MAG: hypothetical protein M1837_001321 [Sclerophora amabilis]|nr:MAG: hypothetical protein M1837_001321 [Sclerophora amabilis]
MTDKLPPNLLALFAPRPALRYLPPSDHAPEDRKTYQIGGVAQFLDKIDDSDGYVPTESWLQRRDRLKLERKEKQEKLLTEGVHEYRPADDPQARGDAFKTLFVARLAYETKESDLEREFGRFGPIERIRIVTDAHANDKEKEKKKKKPHKGYGFIVYEREKDMKAAYKETDGIRIKDRRVLVDVERGRTVKGWKPRRYGGGLGGRGYTKAVATRPAGPPGGIAAPAGPGGFRGGGFRGGFSGRGGFRGGGGGGFSQGRGGIGYSGGGRGGFGGSPNGFSGGQPPPNAPSGPGGGRSGSGGGAGYGSGGYGGSSGGGFGDRPGGPSTNGGGYGEPRGGRSYDDSRSSYRDSRGHGDRDPRSGGASGSNREPVRPRESGGYRDRDREGGYSSRHRDDDYSSSRKRYHDGEFDEPRQRRRY